MFLHIYEMMVEIFEEVWYVVFILSDSGFEVRPLGFNIVKVRGVGRQEEDMGSFFFNGLSCLRRLMKGSIVQDDPIPLFQNRNKAFSNPCIKNSRVCMSPESERSFHFLVTVSGNDCSSGMSYFP